MLIHNLFGLLAIGLLAEDANTVVSSSNDRKYKDLEFCISLIYNKNEIGPSIEPFCTPQFILSRLDCTPLNSRYCFLWDK